jgi:hypothetical protein
MQEATMPTRRPVTPISEKGVPLKDAATDAQLIHGLMERLPNDLTASVTAVLGRSLSSDLRAALGAPEIIVTHFVQHAKESGRSLNEKELTRSVEAALRELGGDSAAAVEPAVVKEELEHAQHALVTHWLSLLITAWDLWGQPADGLALNPKNLLPDQETCPQREALRDTVISLNEALVSTVALDIERDVPRALEVLASSVYADAQHRPVTLPRGFTVKRIGRDVRLHHDVRQNAARTQVRPQSTS